MKKSNEEESKIWGCFLHLSFNMWEDYISPHRPFRGFRPYLELSEPLWNDAINKMAEEGINLVAIELGDAVEYKCYPEIAVHNAWKPERLLKEVERIKSLGMEPIPALNFSAGHDTWMGEYSRMVSTDEYYKFCADIIDEICDIFGNPRFFHLGLDEESHSHQHYQSHITIRKNDAWWSDFYILIGEVMKHGSRPWIWSDYMLWNEPEQFFSKMPKSVIQSNWYYGETLDANQTRVKAYIDLEAHKFDQIPTGSFHDNNFKSIGNTVKFCSEHIDDSRLMGFLQTFWKPTIEEYRDLIIQGIELLGEAKRNHLG